MQYISTRGSALTLSFPDVVLTGLASDGGLYLPKSYPQFTTAEWQRLAGLPYPELSARIIESYVGGTIPYSDLLALFQSLIGICTEQPPQLLYLTQMKIAISLAITTVAPSYLDSSQPWADNLRIKVAL